MLPAGTADLPISTFLALVFGVVAFLIGLWLLRVIGDEEQQIMSSLLPESIAKYLPVNRVAGK